MKVTTNREKVNDVYEIDWKEFCDKLGIKGNLVEIVTSYQFTNHPLLITIKTTRTEQL